jgi:chromosome segregation ATPase
MSDSHTPVALYYTREGLGAGLFDQLMESIDKKLQSKYNQQRLNGADYAKVYVGALEGALGNTTQYLVANLLIEEQRAKTNKEIELLDKQIEQASKEIEKIDAEIEVLKLQPLLTDAQINKINAEIDYLEAQKAMMDAQKEKIDKEIEFLDAKIRTEYANTVGSYADSASLVGRQKSLLVAQKLGFAGDLQAKAAKMHSDFAGISETVNEAGQAVLNDDSKTAISLMDTTASQIKNA